MMKMQRMNLMISRKFHEEEDFDDSVDQDLSELNDMSDEESDDEHDENEKNEFEDIEQVAYFLNPFGTLRIECIYSFARHHENLQRGKWHSHLML